MRLPAYAVERRDSSHPLRGCWAEIDRAREHLDALDTAITRLRSNPPRVAANQDIDANDQCWVVTLAIAPDYGTNIGALCGDIVHNLRSALDSIVFELAFIDNGGKEKGGTGFPLLRDIRQWKDPAIRSPIKHLSDRHRALILRHQPYKKPRPAHGEALALLADLPNDDKHRLLQPIVFTSESVEFEFKVPDDFIDCVGDPTRGVIPLTTTNPERGTELLRLPVIVIGPNPRVYVKCNLSGYETLRNGHQIVGLLRAAEKEVSTITEAFEREFATPEAIALRGTPRFGRIRPIDSRFDKFEWELIAHPPSP